MLGYGASDVFVSTHTGFLFGIFIIAGTRGRQRMSSMLAGSCWLSHLWMKLERLGPADLLP